MYQWHVRSIRINLPQSLRLETKRIFPEGIGLKRRKEKKPIGNDITSSNTQSQLIYLGRKQKEKHEIRRKIYFEWCKRRKR